MAPPLIRSNSQQALQSYFVNYGHEDEDSDDESVWPASRPKNSSSAFLSGTPPYYYRSNKCSATPKSPKFGSSGSSVNLGNNATSVVSNTSVPLSIGTPPATPANAVNKLHVSDTTATRQGSFPVVFKKRHRLATRNGEPTCEPASKKSRRSGEGNQDTSHPVDDTETEEEFTAISALTPNERMAYPGLMRKRFEVIRDGFEQHQTLHKALEERHETLSQRLEDGLESLHRDIEAKRGAHNLDDELARVAKDQANNLSAEIAKVKQSIQEKFQVTYQSQRKEINIIQSRLFDPGSISLEVNPDEQPMFVQVNRLASEVNDLQSQQKGKVLLDDPTWTSYTRKVSKLEKDLNALSQREVEREISQKAVQKQLEEASEESTELFNTNNKLIRDELKVLQYKIAGLEGRFDGGSKNLEDFRKGVEGNQKETRSALVEVDQVVKDHTSRFEKLEGLIKSQEEACRKLRSNNNWLKEKTVGLEEGDENMKGTLDEIRKKISSLRQQLDNLRDEWEVTSELKQAVEAQGKAVEVQRKSVEDHAEWIRKFSEKDMDVMLAKPDELEDRLQTLEQDMANSAEVRKESSELQEKFSALQNSYKDMEEKLVGLAQENQAFKHHTEKRQEQEANMQAELSALKNSYQDVEKKLGGLVQENQTFKANAKRKQGDEADLQAKFGALQSGYEEMEKKLVRLTQENKAFEAHGEQRKREEEAHLQEKLRALQSSYERMHNDYEDMEKKLSRLAQETEGWKSHTEQRKQEDEAHLQEKFSVLQSNYKDVVGRLVRLAQEHQDLRVYEKEAERQEKFSALQSGYKEIQQRLVCLTQEHQAFKFHTEQRKHEEEAERQKRLARRVDERKLLEQLTAQNRIFGGLSRSSPAVEGGATPTVDFRRPSTHSPVILGPRPLVSMASPPPTGHVPVQHYHSLPRSSQAHPSSNQTNAPSWQVVTQPYSGTSPSAACVEDFRHRLPLPIDIDVMSIAQ